MVDAACFTNLAVIALIAAVGAMQLVLARDGTTGQPVTDVVEPSDMAAQRELNTGLQGRTAKLRNPFDATSLAWYAWIIARLGGWSGYISRGYKPPGPKTIHRGMIIVEQFHTGCRLAIRSANVGRAPRGFRPASASAKGLRLRATSSPRSPFPLAHPGLADGQEAAAAASQTQGGRDHERDPS